jgi:hypothetical protein
MHGDFSFWNQQLLLLRPMWATAHMDGEATLRLQLNKGKDSNQG